VQEAAHSLFAPHRPRETARSGVAPSAVLRSATGDAVRPVSGLCPSAQRHSPHEALTASAAEHRQSSAPFRASLAAPSSPGTQLATHRALKCGHGRLNTVPARLGAAR
jgi:hypothetical protein